MYYRVQKDQDYWTFCNWSDVVHFLINVLDWKVVKITRHIQGGDSYLFVFRYRFKKSYSFRLLKRRFEILKALHPDVYEKLNYNSEEIC